MKYLITGGTGSFGQAMAGRLLKDQGTEVVRIFSRGELKQAQMAKAFGFDPSSPDEKMRFFIGDVRDKDRLLRAMREVDVVLHAAALKRIEVGEYNPDEAIKTNVLGSMNVAECAVEAGVQKCLLISSDKAVDPSSTYGATKMLAERIFSQAQYSFGDPETVFLTVRYGNVAGSNGSVIPWFKQLAANFEPLPVTSPDMTRFFITMDEAVDLVLLALQEGRSGEIFVKKLASVEIMRVAQTIVDLDYGSRIMITGVGPGEKMHECLISRNELCRTFDYGGYFIVCPLMSNREQSSCRSVSEPFTSDAAVPMTDAEIRRLVA